MTVAAAAPQPVIVLTDPEPSPRSQACQKCGAGRDKRLDASGFGQPKGSAMVCGECGTPVPEETL